MKNNRPSIVKRPAEENYYRVLQEKTLKRLQDLSGEIWTDFNVHDPGVTIADYMNYSLFELEYKMKLPFETILGSDKSSYAAMGIHTAETITSPSIVTQGDYEQLFLREIKELKSCNVTFKDGFYHVEAGLAGVKDRNSDLTTDEERAEKIKDRIYEIYHANRNFCEDIHFENISLTNDVVHSQAKKLHPDLTTHPVAGKSTESQPEIAPYRSMQYDFPAIYGLGEEGLSEKRYRQHSGHVLQLKSYLLIADFMISDATNLLRNTAKQIRLDGVLSGETPTVKIPGMEKIIDRKRVKVSGDVSESPLLHVKKNIQSRKTAYLDLLDILYGENTRAFYHEFHPAKHENEYRAGLTEALPDLNRDRFKSFDKLHYLSTAPLNDLVSLLYGSERNNYIPLHERMNVLQLNLLSDANFFAQYDVYLNLDPISGVFYTPIFNEQPEEIDYRPVEWKDSMYPILKEQIILLKQNAVFESFLEHGSKPSNYRMIRLIQTNRWLLVFRYPGKNEWLMMGIFTDEERLIRAANNLWALIKSLNPDRRLFYIVEHNLLAGSDEKNGDTAAKISVVSGGNYEDEHAKEKLDRFLTSRIPAHLQLNIYHTPPGYLYDFARLYPNWRRALAENNEQEIRHLSRSIATYFEVSKQYLHSIR